MGDTPIDPSQPYGHCVVDPPLYRSAGGVSIRRTRGVAEVQQREGARGFDAPGATYPHKDEQERCSFEALVEEYCPEDAVLREIARIVRGADFSEEVTLTPESAGLRAISHGFPLVAKDDYEIMEKAAFLYDSLYAALQKQRTETSQPNEAL